MKLNKTDFIINSIYSILVTILFFNVFVHNPGYANLSDFFTGETIYANHNKYYDLAFFFVYLIVYVILLYPYKALKHYVFNYNKTNHKIIFLLGILALFCFGAFFNFRQVFVDPHHQAEHFNSFFMHTKYNMEYYKDIMLVHGTRDAAPGWLGFHFFGSDNLYSYYLGTVLFHNLLAAGYLILSFLVFSNGLFFLVPVLGLSVHDNLFVLLGLYILAFLVLLKKTVFNHPFRFLFLYIILSFAFASFWTTMGILWVIAALPAAIYCLIKLLKSENKYKKLFVLVFVSLICLALSYKTLPYFLHQAAFYAKSNLYAFGTVMPKINSNYCGYFIKLFAIISFPVFSILAFKESKKEDKNLKYLFALVFSAVLTLFSLNYTLGRIDSDTFVRLSYLSYTCLFITVPYLLYVNYKKIPEIFFKYLSLIALLTLFFLTFQRCIDVVRSGILFPQKASVTSLKNVGNLDIRNDEKAALEDITSFINKHMKKDDIFLELTNKGILYSLLDKKMPIPYSSYYNVVNTAQSNEIVKKLKNNEPDIIFINDSSGRNDELYPSLRVNPLYRHMLLSGSYRLINDKKDNALLLKEKHIFTDNEKQNLDRYLAASNIKYLPDAWGASLNTLPTTTADLGYTLQKAETPDAAIINIHLAKPVNGKDIELIYLEIPAHKESANYVMKINGSPSILYFQSRTNKMLIPFDNYPSWLLNENVTDITIKTNLKFTKKPEIKLLVRDNMVF